MLLHRRLVVCCLWFWNENRFFLFNFKRIIVARSAGNRPLAETMHRTQGDGDAMLIEPLGDLFVSPMLAAQSKNGFAVRFQFAARPAFLLGFGL